MSSFDQETDALITELAAISDQLAGELIRPDSEVPAGAKAIALAIREAGLRIAILMREAQSH